MLHSLYCNKSSLTDTVSCRVKVFSKNGLLTKYWCWFWAFQFYSRVPPFCSCPLCTSCNCQETHNIPPPGPNGNRLVPAPLRPEKLFRLAHHAIFKGADGNGLRTILFIKGKAFLLPQVTTFLLAWFIISYSQDHLQPGGGTPRKIGLGCAGSAARFSYPIYNMSKSEMT